MRTNIKQPSDIKKPAPPPAPKVATQTFPITGGEIEFLIKSPEALRLLINYHDFKICEGESMGFNCSYHHNRIAELKAEAERLDILYNKG